MQQRDNLLLPATGSLCAVLFKHIGAKSPYFQEPSRTILPPIMVLISWIHHLPIQHRKALLDACRIQAPIWENKTLSQSFLLLSPVEVETSIVDIILLDAQHLATQFNAIYPFPVLCSLLSYSYGRRAPSTFRNSCNKSKYHSTKKCRLPFTLSNKVRFSTTVPCLVNPYPVSTPSYWERRRIDCVHCSSRV